MHQSASLFVLGSFVVACSAKVAQLPRPGESLPASAFTAEAGGKGFNLAVGAHRLGAKVDGIFAIGNDFFSQLALSAFAEAGLSPAMLCRFEATTGSGIGFTDAEGENCIAVHPGANLLLSAREIRAVADKVRRADLVLAQFEVSDDSILEAFALARGDSSKTLLNPSPFRPIAPDILQRTSILVLNRVEAAQIAKVFGLTMEPGVKTWDPLGAALLDRGPEIVIITLGGEGAVAYQHGVPSLFQPPFIVNVIDTLGAGDAFTAGLATSLLHGHSLERSLERAAACGGIACEGFGVFRRLPSASDLEGFLTRGRQKS